MGPMNVIMEVVYTTCKGKHLNTMEKYYIYLEINRGIQINDKNTVLNNSILIY